MAKGGKSYLLIDHRGSGQGYREMDVLTCAHCNRGVVLNPLRQRERGYCRRCDHYLCDSPGCNVECTPFQQTIDLALKHPNEPWGLVDQHGKPLARLQELRDKERIF